MFWRRSNTARWTVSCFPEIVNDFDSTPSLAISFSAILWIVRHGQCHCDLRVFVTDLLDTNTLLLSAAMRGVEVQEVEVDVTPRGAEKPIVIFVGKT